MRILVTNDDGIQSEGVKTLAELLSKKGHKVTVVAPDGNRSAFSHSLSIYKKLTFLRQNISENFEAYSLSGTPADCVKFAVHYFETKPFDFVCSGINGGNNLGSDTCYSGTVAAGLEANFFGIKSIAFSNVANKDFDFKENAEAIDEIFDKLVEISDGGYVLNVNLPNGKHKGVKIVPLGVQKYTDEYQKNDDGTYMLTGYPICLEKGEYCDVEFSNKKYITVAPIMYDRTAKDIVNKYKDMEF